MKMLGDRHAVNRASIFPLPFKSVRTISGGKEGSYLIGAMFTASYSAEAERLAASCEKFGLQYAIHEVPSVHKATSDRGTEDLTYTKANFIRHLLANHKKPVLYLDVDCTFVSHPHLIDQLVRSRRDFAIYNWCADEHTDMFAPVDLGSDANKAAETNRFYRFTGSMDFYTRDQLVCSGLVQFYRNSMAARALLSRWHQTIANFDDCVDDGALAFTFNNLTRRSWLWWLLRTQWLPKAYARISWWIYVKPIINHPGIPKRTSRNADIKDSRGRNTFYKSRAELRNVTRLFPEDCIIDTQKQMICRLSDGELVPIRSTEQGFWP